MADLFTVTFERKHFITKYAADGKVTRVETTIKETSTDLPYRTAQSFRDKYPDANVQIFPQERPIGAGHTVGVSADRNRRRTEIDRSKFDGTATKRVAQPAPRTTTHRSKAAEPAPVAGYADLINKLAKEGAS